jgi:hypothetical protein
LFIDADRVCCIISLEELAQCRVGPGLVIEESPGLDALQIEYDKMAIQVVEQRGRRFVMVPEIELGTAIGNKCALRTLTMEQA